MQAFYWGIISSVSLPLGAVLALMWRPGSRLSSALMAFGAGALLFALSVELMSHVPAHAETHGLLALVAALLGALAGGLLFDVFNQLLNNRGAFLRNISNAKNYVARTKKARARRMLRGLSHIKALRELPSQTVAELVKYVRKEHYRDGELIFHAGDKAEEIHFIRRGGVDIFRYNRGAPERIVQFTEQDTFGELAVLEDSERETEARARGAVDLYTLEKDDLKRAFEQSPELFEALQAMATARIEARFDKQRSSHRLAWERDAGTQLDDLNMAVSAADIHQERQDIKPTASAAVAIWLGIAIDGIPESLIIGSLSIDPQGMSIAFIAGVFMANLPEALSSSIAMRESGMSKTRVVLMWGSLCLLTGLGAALGAAVLPPDPLGNMFFVVLGIESLAAGAMLTMIAETMLPEAFENGGSIVGIATLLGFLAALSVASGV